MINKTWTEKDVEEQPLLEETEEIHDELQNSSSFRPVSNPELYEYEAWVSLVWQ